MTTPQMLRSWAKGSLTTEAATELLLRAFNGRFAGTGQPWIGEEAGGSWVDFDAIPENIGGLSGGEKRFLLIVASIGGGTDVALSDVITGLDRQVLDLVLAALAHAAGSHQDSVVLDDDAGALSFQRADTLHPWPVTTPAFHIIDGGKD